MPQPKAGVLSYRFAAYHVLPDSPQMQHDFLQMAASLAARSGEPFAEDIVRVARLNLCAPVDVNGFQEFPCRGLGGLVQLPNEHHPRAVVQGTREFIVECGLQMPDILEVTARKWEKESAVTIALAGWDGWVRGVLKFEKTASGVES